MKKLLTCTAAVLGMVLVTGVDAEAGHPSRCRNSLSNNHNGHNNHSSHYNNYGTNRSRYSRNSWRPSPRYSNNSYGFSYSNNRYSFSLQHNTPRYYDTSHFDYHSPSLQRYGNHYGYVPGHYHFHRTGHWNY